MRVERKKYSFLFKNTIILSIGQLGGKLIYFFLLPLYTNILTTAEYGIADLIMTTCELLYPFLTLNIASSVFRFVIEDRGSKLSILQFGIKISIIGTGIGFVGAIAFERLSVVSWPCYCYLLLPMILAAISFYHLVNNYLMADEKTFDAALAGLIVSFVTAGTDILFLAVFRMGLKGYLLAMATGQLFAVIYGFSRIGRNIFSGGAQKLVHSKKREMLQYSFPLIFNSVAWWINSSIDKYFVAHVCGESDTGIYSVSYKIPTVMTLIMNTFIQAWGLSAVKEFDSEDSDGFFTKTYTLCNGCAVLLCSIMTIFNVFIARLLFAKEFFGAWKYSSILLLSVLFSMMGGYAGAVFSAVKKNRSYAISTIVSAVANVVLNAVLIPRFGSYGAAIATVISFFLMWLIRVVTASRYIRWKLDLKKDFLAYGFLVLQVFIDHSSDHCYLLQVAIWFLLVLLYSKTIQQIFKMTVSKAKSILKEKA